MTTRPPVASAALTAALMGALVAGCAAPAPTPSAPVARPTTSATSAPPARTGGVTDLMAGLAPRTAPTKAPDAAFTAAMADFSVALLQRMADGHDNVLLSPLVVELALAMTANGASGDTLAQMEKVLADGASLEDLNAALPAFAASLPSTDKARFRLADSIWLRDAPEVNILPAFLQTNADYYRAGVFRAPFDDATLAALNAWVKEHTDGMIPTMLDRLEPDLIMVLLSALSFDAEWAVPYDESVIKDGVFTSASGAKQTSRFMSSIESAYLDDGLATGFAKPYAGGAYRFVALLPNAGVSLADYLASLTGDGLVRTLRGAQDVPVNATLPQFSFDYSADLGDALKAMGMPLAFEAGRADFSRMGTAGGNPLYIGYVKQKTFIDVTPLGTRAGAAAAVGMKAYGALLDPKTVTLDRPFVFGIVDAATNLPVFLGVANSVAA